MEKIYALIDYHGFFGSKYDAIPYNSGMDKDLLTKYFSDTGYEIIFVYLSEVINKPSSYWAGKKVIYTSTEDSGYHYKSFIEDIVHYLELCKAWVIPNFKYLRAHNNKVFMELLRYQFNDIYLSNLKSNVFGSLEEVNIDRIQFPIVYKTSEGAMSDGVRLSNNRIELRKNIKKLSRTRNYLSEVWEKARFMKYRGYRQESKYRKKFILQDFIEELTHDYKILIYGNKYYLLKRHIKDNDFRASGSGLREFSKEIPSGILEYAQKCKLLINVPNISLDIAYSNNQFYLLEFQCVYFGPYTITFSKYYWLLDEDENKFNYVEGSSILEREYSNSIIEFIEKK